VLSSGALGVGGIGISIGRHKESRIADRSTRAERSWDTDGVRLYEKVVDLAARSFGLQVSRISSSGNNLPAEVAREDRLLIDRVQPYTMTSPERLWSLIDGVRFIIQENLAGDFVECGVWRGGSVMAMALELNRLGVSDRNIWLYDTFAGMTEPTDLDVESGTGKSAAELLRTTDVGDGNNVWCVADRTDVEANITSTGYPMGLMTLVEGDVSETLHQTLPSEVALLRLDTDWYESTKSCMEMLYPKLVPGGVCILDDYGHWAGARQAVDEYFDNQGSRPYMHVIDFGGRVFTKPRSHDMGTG